MVKKPTKTRVKNAPPRKASTSGKNTAGKSDGKPSYSAKDIYVLEGLEPVRKRPGMYIGTTGVDGLHHLIWEVLDNSIDEAMAGYAKNITVELLPENVVRVTDDGRGIPVETHAQTKKSALETVMTTLHAGGKFGGESYKVSGGLHGVGVSVTNALSETLKAEVCRDGGLYEQEYKRGDPKGKVKKVGSSKATGTRITFKPDSQIFSTIEWNEKRILERLREEAYLTKGVRITFIDARGKMPQAMSFCFEGGLLSFVKRLANRKKLIQDRPFYVHKSDHDVEVEAAFLYSDDTAMTELSFANNIHTPDGGTHLTGFRSALTRALNSYARSKNVLKEKDENFTSDDVREGMIAIVAVKIREPQFEGQTKARLGSTEAQTAVASVVAAALSEFLEKNPSDGRQIVEKASLTARARMAAKAARETVLRKGALEGMTLPGKLADCSSKHAEESELFIVEGDSAGGSAKAGRNRQTQAILPLRGKILNVERARIDKMLANEEIRNLVIAIGTAIAEEFDIEKLRYHKIIVMSDADVDGAHIRTLLLTLFYRYFRPIVEGGFLYVAVPPLYQIKAGKEIRYAFTDEEKDKFLIEFEKIKDKKSKIKNADKKKNQEKTIAEEIGEGMDESAAREGDEKIKGVNIQRYKGLGEMNPDQLWETTMNPETRLMKRITVDDAAGANKLFDILMGNDVDPRKKFIQTHAAGVKNLDI